MRIPVVLLPVATWVAVAGCGGGQKSAGTPVSAQEFPARYASALCTLIKGCCEASGGSSDDACAGAVTAEMTSHGDLAAADGATWDATAAGRCLEAVGKTDCAVDLAQFVEALQVCDDIWKGVVAPGGACQTYYSCAELPVSGGATAGASCINGMCVATVRQPPGGTCDGATVYCDPLRATCSVTTGMCVALPGPNEGCLISCRVGSDCRDGVCAPLLAAGAACVADADCASERCSSGLCVSTIAALVDDYCALP